MAKLQCTRGISIFRNLHDLATLVTQSISDGPSATGAFFLGGRNVVPQVEAVEARVPIRIRSQRLVPDSGGAGRWRGGLGVETRIELLEDSELAVRNERTRVAPRGRDGGADGRAGVQYAVSPDGQRRDIPAKIANHRIPAGDTFVLVTSGGGGLGDPAARDPEALREDLAERHISAEASRRDYGQPTAEGSS